jgi:aspartate aminotransferase
VVEISKRLEGIAYSPSMNIADQARALERLGRPVIDLSLGELNFATPGNIADAGINAIRNGATRYDSAAGLMALRQSIRGKLRRENGLQYAVNQISVGCGAKQIISSAMFATLGAGDEVLIPVPYWTSYPDMVRLAGGKSVPVPCLPEHGFKLQPRALADAVSKRSKWLMLNSPNNPSGAVYSASELLAIARVLAEFPHVGVISDDIYEKMVFAPALFSNIVAVAPDLYERTLVVNGVSKTYAMTGWRVGYGAGPADLMRAINVVQSQTTTHTSTISQYAAVEALDGPNDVAQGYALEIGKRAEIAVRLVARTPGLTCVPPAGALYCFANCEALLGRRSPTGPLNSDVDVARYLLETAFVAVVPGGAYGLSPYLRISFAADPDLIESAFQRIAEAIDRLT